MIDQQLNQRDVPQMARDVTEPSNPRPPGSRTRSFHTCQGSPTTPGRMSTRDDASIRVAFHENDHVGTRDYLAFAAQWLYLLNPVERQILRLGLRE